MTNQMSWHKWPNKCPGLNDQSMYWSKWPMKCPGLNDQWNVPVSLADQMSWFKWPMKCPGLNDQWNVPVSLADQVSWQKGLTIQLLLLQWHLRFLMSESLSLTSWPDVLGRDVWQRLGSVHTGEQQLADHLTRHIITSHAVCLLICHLIKIRQSPVRGAKVYEIPQKGIYFFN